VNEKSENRHFQLPHSNPSEYKYKPYTARNFDCQKLRSMGYIFVTDSIWVALQIFEQFCPKAGNANPLIAKPETDFNPKWQFKVMYFGIIEQPVRGYIAQYNKCGLRCEALEDKKIK